VDLGYTLNEHGIYHLEHGIKSELVNKTFRSEKDIFDFLGMVYKEPVDRKDGRFMTLEVIQTQISDLQTRGLDTFREQELEVLLQAANQAYYGGNTPIMSDEVYDMICDYMSVTYPTNKIAKVGHVVLTMDENVKHKARLPFELWSMNKIKEDVRGLEKWKTQYNGPYVLSCKLDGVSGMYVSPDKLYTRGNGKIGQDISHMIPYLQLPKKEGLVIRGEIIIPKDVFIKKYSSDFSNPRNFVAGIVNQKPQSVANRLKDIHFVAYEILQPSFTPSKQLHILSKLDMPYVTYMVSSEVSVERLSNQLHTWRASCEYEIDGIICCNDNIYPRKTGNPEHAFAYKMPHADQTAETKVVDVIWTVSKDGYLKPRIKIEPVVIGGTRIEYTTGFNAKFIVDHNIGHGAVISLIRSGDVIPHVQEVLQQAESPLMPSVNYKWNNTAVDILLDDYKTDSTVNEKVNTLFFKTIGVDGLGAGNIKKIMEAGYTTIPDILSMSQEAFLQVDGFKEKLSDKLYHGIKNKFQEASLPVLMEATNIFGRGFGKKKFQMILNDIPDIIVSTESDYDKISKVTNIDGMAKTTAEKFIGKLNEFKEWAEKVGIPQDKLICTHAVDSTNVLFGKRIVMSGFRDKSLIEKIELAGAKVSGSVSKQTDLVIVKDMLQESSKSQDAKSYGIPIVSYHEFLDTYNTMLA
jgi:NAD-dependent DNA ligase